MKAYEIIERLFQYGKDFNYTTTCDTLKAGNPEAEVTKIAVTMNPTVNVIKESSAWGAELLIVHEPLYYNHMDEHSDEPQEVEKRNLLNNTGLTVYRFHDHPHRASYPDMIALGELRDLDMEIELEYTDIFALTRFKLKNPLTPVELAKRIEEKLGIKHVRIAGARDVKCKNVSTLFGAPGDLIDELSREETEILIVGETCEWRCAEYARDAAELGKTKALLVLGHEGSERAGMVYVTDKLKELVPELEVKYFESGEVYTYTD